MKEIKLHNQRQCEITRKNMKRVLIIIIILTLFFVFLGLRLNNRENENPPKTNPPETADRLLPVNNKNWIYEGPIYNVNTAYYKGGLKELTEWIPYIKDVGIKTIYLMTIWSGRSYTPDDYYKINPKHGTEQDLKNLVEAVHKYDMKILLDLVTGYSNTNSENFIYNNHPEWHIRDKQGNRPVA